MTIACKRVKELKVKTTLFKVQPMSLNWPSDISWDSKWTPEFKDMAATTEFCNSPPSQTAWKQIKFFFFYRENLLLVQVWQNKTRWTFFLSLPDQDMKKNPRVLFFENVKRASRLVQSFNAATMKYILLPFDLQCKEKKVLSTSRKNWELKFRNSMDVLTHFSLSYPLGFLCFYSSIFIILSVSLFLSLSPPLSFFSGFLSLSVFLSLSLTSFLQSHNCAFLIFEQLYALLFYFK